MKAILHGNGTLRQRLLACFAVLAILPLLLSVLFSFRNDRKQILENRDQIAGMDVQQITRDLDMELAAYENVLYQLYTDDELSALVKDLNEGRDLAVTRNQIRRKLRGVFWLQDYITSLMVITQSGETVFYDRLSFSGQTNVALEALGLSPSLLFDGLSGPERHYLSAHPLRDLLQRAAVPPVLHGAPDPVRPDQPYRRGDPDGD